MPTILINPFDETPRPIRLPAPRAAALQDKKIGLLDIRKPGGSVFLTRMERLLRERYGVVSIVHTAKPTFGRPAPDEVIEELVREGCGAVIEALAD